MIIIDRIGSLSITLKDLPAANVMAAWRPKRQKRSQQLLSTSLRTLQLTWPDKRLRKHSKTFSSSLVAVIVFPSLNDNLEFGRMIRFRFRRNFPSHYFRFDFWRSIFNSRSFENRRPLSISGEVGLRMRVTGSLLLSDQRKENLIHSRSAKRLVQLSRIIILKQILQ